MKALLQKPKDSKAPAPQQKAGGTALSRMANGSERVLQQAAMAQAIHRSPRMRERAPVVQARFYERDPAGNLVWWARPMMLAGGEAAWKKVIDPATGQQQMYKSYGVWRAFDKRTLDRQQVKGTRAADGNTPGLTLGLAPGSRNWPGSMSGPAKSAAGRRNALSGPVPKSPGNTAWGHQVAMQWGGPANQDNAASVTNDGGAGEYAQEQYQTEVENAVTNVAARAGYQLADFRIKHTAYNYPGTHVAKYMRIKIYWSHAGVQHKLVDQVTPDSATHLAGGAPVAAFRTMIENQLKSGAAGALPQKHGTAPAVEPSSAAAATAPRP